MFSWLQGEPSRDGHDGDPGAPGQLVGGVMAGSHDSVKLVKEAEMTLPRGNYPASY